MNRRALYLSAQNQQFRAMPEGSGDPPPKRYGFKVRDFERANEPRRDAASPESRAPAKRSTEDPAGPIDVYQLHADASTPGPVLGHEAPVDRPNQIHIMLRENAAIDAAAGMDEVSLEGTSRPRRLRRWRDYLLLLVGGDTLLAVLATHAHRAGDVFLFASTIGGLGAYTAGVTWVVLFLMDY